MRTLPLPNQYTSHLNPVRLGLALLVLCLAVLLFAAPARSQADAPFAIVAAGDSRGVVEALEAANLRGSGASPFTVYLQAGDYYFQPYDGASLVALPAVTGNVTLIGHGATLWLGTPARSQFGTGLLILQGGKLTLQNLSVRLKESTGRALRNQGELILNDSMMAGSLFNEGRLTVARTAFVGIGARSSADNGGAILNEGEAVITCSRFSDNLAAQGGAIFNGRYGQIRVERSTFTGNKANGGGAIFNLSGPLVRVENSYWPDGASPEVNSLYAGVDTISERVEAINPAASDPTLNDPACALQPPPPVPTLPDPSAGGLFLDPATQGVTAPVSIPMRTGLLRSRPVMINFAAMGGAGLDAPAAEKAPLGERLMLNLFDDSLLYAARERVEAIPSGGYVWVGRVEGEPFSEVYFSFGPGSTAYGLIFRGGTAFEMTYSGNGALHLLSEIDNSQLGDCAGAVLPPEIGALVVPSTALPAEPANAPVPASDDGSLIDLLVVYLPIARDGAGGTTAILNEIYAQVAVLNQAYINTKASQRVRLVHVAEMNYAEIPDWNDQLSNLAGKTDGYMDEVHTLRDQYKADMVSLVKQSDNSSTCGIAYVMQTVSTSFEPYAFSVTSRKCFSNLTFPHELGHNMGSQHNIENSFSAPAYPYSYGYRDPEFVFRTIMSYNCSGQFCPRINYFSNTVLTYSGKVMGHATADNRQSLNNTANTMANLRDANQALNLTEVGIFQGGNWWLRAQSGSDFAYVWQGGPGWTPVVGDWDGDGKDSPGIFQNGNWWLHPDVGEAGGDTYVWYGGAGWTPLVGDWDGDGKDSPGIFQGGNWWLRNDLGEAGDYGYIWYGDGTWTPLVGDWDGDGKDSPGIFQGGNWWLRNDYGESGDYGYIWYGGAGWTALSGDWDGDGKDSPGIFQNGAWWLRNDYNESGENFIWYGGAGWTPVVGDWNGRTTP